MIFLTTTKVIVESLPKESFWSSKELWTTLISTIFASVVSFTVASIPIKEQRKQFEKQRELEIQRMNAERKLEIQKMKVELDIEELNQDLKVLNEIYMTSCSICNYYRNEKCEVDTTDIDFKTAYIKAVDLITHNIIKIQHKTYSKNIKELADNFNKNIKKDLSLFKDGGLIEARIRKSWEINMNVSYTLITTDIPQEKLRLLDSIGK